MTRKIPERATHLEVVKIGKRLEEVCQKLEDGVCVYQEGHSDASIAREIGCSKASVSNLRIQMMGKLREPSVAATNGAEIDALKQTISAQAKEIADLQFTTAEQSKLHREQIGRVIGRYNHLVEHLVINRVINSTKDFKIKPADANGPNGPLNA